MSDTERKYENARFQEKKFSSIWFYFFVLIIFGTIFFLIYFNVTLSVKNMSNMSESNKYLHLKLLIDLPQDKI